MSCIENNKIKSDRWILEFIADKLELNIDYLLEGIEEQIERRLNDFKDKDQKKIDEEELKYLINFSEEAECYDHAMKAMHLLFNYYLDNEMFERLQTVNSKYYHICQMAYTKENQIMFYLDEARYFYANKEYSQAKLYFANVCAEFKDIEELTGKLKRKYIISKYNLAICEIMMDNPKECYNIIMDLKEYINESEDKYIVANIYNLLAVSSLYVGDEKYTEYEDKARDLYGDNHKAIAIMLHNIGETYLKLNKQEDGMKCLIASFEIFPKNEEKERLEFIINSLDLFIKNEYNDTAAVLCDEALNVAILLNDIKVIDKAYYFKAKLLFKANNFTLAEMYMNLSLDSLKKFGNRDELSERYNELGHMYYKSKNNKEALKYFDLALKFKNKL
ncbi:hypothetical protein [Oceanirhabdus sp. W0125-5]|uniref:hypothetical protein n=1 Tax=Oceanirhabdus sp. W0125-5 TaxID=2999116 RepID=UPI0022F2B8F4|nr:hypothetical protein [Oceanirhabdus sp. W0125-5]WBW98692.1 hypothetical protein OW730_08015 [Oceanirhabdus sp. W0125-5]